MAARRPTGTLRQAIDRTGMDRPADDDVTALHFLEMAFETKICVAHGEHLGVDRAMRAVAAGATFVHRFVLEDIRPALIGVALKTGCILRTQRRASTDVRKSFMR